MKTPYLVDDKILIPWYNGHEIMRQLETIQGIWILTATEVGILHKERDSYGRNFRNKRI